MSAPTHPGADAPSATPAAPRPGVLRWAADLAMGARFAVTGGREGWVRTALTTLGVGLGVVLLLAAGSVPSALQARDDRKDARAIPGTGEPVKRGPDTLLIRNTNTVFRDKSITAVHLWPEGDRAAPPPGLSALPKPGEMAASPALKRLLDDPGNQVLRKRFPEEVTATIGDTGLVGPQELFYYAGGLPGDEPSDPEVNRIDHWGDGLQREPTPPALVLLIIIGCVVLLLPVAVFIATAVRFGGDRRDRRLAALRLVGADRGMTRRIAAGEALCGSLLGLAAGTGLFLGLRPLVGGMELWEVSVFPSDLVPSAPLAALIALAVPLTAVVITLFTMRQVTVEPLGVVRHSRLRRRRLWWRLALPAGGLCLLLPMLGTFGGRDDRETIQVAAGAVLLLIGTTALLPWVVEAVVARLRGGPVAWQLATRRLQLASGTAARAVSGITVAVAGAIAIQMLFSYLQTENVKDTGQDTSSFQYTVYKSVHSDKQAARVHDAYRRTKGVQQALSLVETAVAAPTPKTPDDPATESLFIADCGTLRKVARLPSCADGDVFISRPQDVEPGSFIAAGRGIDLNAWHDREQPRSRLWTIPRGARTVETRPETDVLSRSGVLVTPGALSVSRLPNPEQTISVRLDPGTKDAVEYVRNTDTALDASGYQIAETEENSRFSTIRRGLFIGAVATLLLIGASMVVSTLEQLRERRKLLSVLVAYGTRRSTLSWSVLWQTAVPVVLGLAVSVAGGLTLGAVLLKMIDRPVTVDWASLATMTGFGGAVILLVTLVSLPPLWRLMRPEGLRHE
ncbi:hypothetical protein ACZ90_40140 [Streptomyces albus subsp. albus]|nr:hypothetical protein ACZ90_40140 [Streptomyces albus subsp. albus]